MDKDSNKTTTSNDPEKRRYDVVHIEGAVEQSSKSPYDGGEATDPEEKSGGDSKYKPPLATRLTLGWKKRRQTVFSVATIIISVVALFVIITQAIIYNRQKEIMSQMIEEGEKTRELENRAYVGASRANFKPLETSPHESRIQITLTNTGHTPAIGKATTVLVFTPEQYLPDSFDVRANAETANAQGIVTIPSQVVFLPGADVFVDAGIIPTYNTGLEKPPHHPNYEFKTPVIFFNPNRRVFGANSRLFIVGLIEYRDFFNVERTTVFCYVGDKNLNNVFTVCPNLNRFN